MKKYFIVIVLLMMVLPLISSAQENKTEKIKRMKPALLVIDLQNAFTGYFDKAEKDMALIYVNYAIDLFRKNGYPVIKIQHTDPVNGPKPGTEPFEFLSSVTVTKDDPQVTKTYGDAFNKTGLDKMLKDKGVNTVFVCGFNAVGCVISTFIGAYNHDYVPFFIKDALISHKPNYSNYIADIYDAVSLNVVKVMLENAEK